MFSKFKNFFLYSYDFNREYVLAWKAQFVFWIITILLPVMALLPIVTFLTLGADVASQTSVLAGLDLVSMLFAAYFLRNHKIRVSSNIFAFSGFIISVVGFFLRPAPLAGLSLAFYQVALTVFAMFFCSYYFSIFLYVIVLISNILYYFLVALPAVKTASPFMQQIAVVQLIDMPAALTLIFAVGFFSTRIVNTALAQTVEQTNAANEQADKNSQLLETIKSASVKLSSSIKTTSVVINNFSNNAQTQASSVEQLSSTMEQISAGTTSTTEFISTQSSLLHELIKSIGTLASSIDAMENYGNQISGVFSNFLIMAKKGEESSSKLDETNQKIMTSSNEILSVITIIEDFFDKIKLLSLNATIEAARAGEYGRGFAVVADEIGKISDNSAKELTQISSLIEKNKVDVEIGNLVITDIISFIKMLLSNTSDIQNKMQIILAEIMKQKTLKDGMTSKTKIVSENADKIEIAMSEQERAISDVVSSISLTNVLVQENADNTHELEQSSLELEKLAAILTREFNSEG